MAGMATFSTLPSRMIAQYARQTAKNPAPACRCFTPSHILR